MHGGGGGGDGGGHGGHSGGGGGGGHGPSAEVVAQRALREVGRLAEVLRDVSERADRAGSEGAREELAGAAAKVARPQQAVEAHRQVLVLWRELGDRPREARTLLELGVARCKFGQYGRAVRACTEAQELFRELGDTRGQAEALTELGIIRTKAEQFTEAVEDHRRALLLVAAADEPVLVLRNLCETGRALIELKRYDEAERYYEQAKALGEQVPGSWAAGFGLRLVSRHRTSDRVAELERTAAECAQARDLTGAAAAVETIAELQAAGMWKPDEVASTYRRVTALWMKADDRPRAAGSLCAAAEVWARGARPDKALAQYRRAIILYLQLGDIEAVAAAQRAAEPLEAKLTPLYRWLRRLRPSTRLTAPTARPAVAPEVRP